MQKINRQISAKYLEITLKKICQLTNFSYGEVWLTNEENDFLELSSDYYIVDNRHQQNLELFHECSQGFIMSKGEGLPGRVFLTRESEWMLDVSAESEDCFLRNKIAGICGVATGFAIPLIKEGKVLAVLAFFTCVVRPCSSECLPLAIDLVTNLLAPKAVFDED